MNGIQEIKRLVSQYLNRIDTYKDNDQYNEQACRDEFISPFLECLGWDVQNKKGVSPQYKEVVVEKFSNKAERPDYTLTLNGLSKIFVEAKKPSVNIITDKKTAYQARSYGWNAGHKLSVLTNFEYLIVYDTTNRPNVSDEATVSIYRKYHCSEYESHYKEIYSLLSQESVYSGSFDEFTSSYFQSKGRTTSEIDEQFLEQLNYWRLQIGLSLYNISEKYRNIDLLNDVVQEFIDQIVFLRICEDRNLPLYEKLRDAAETKDELKESLTKLFKEVDKRYNSKLFAGKNILFDLDNEIIFNMIYCLYYPYSPYLFNIIEPNILGKIYEAFLTERLILNKDNLLLAKKKEFKDRAVVTTPIEIVKYMVKNTLEPLCKGKTPQEILNLKIADIACGSGIFLEEAFQYLLNYCIDWYLKKEPSHLIELSNGKRKLPLEEKKAILTNCIWGIDIDYHAAEVCKLSLLIKLIEDETESSVYDSNPILPNLDSNIKNGNSLISRDDIEDAPISLLKKIKPFDWNNINDGNPFDAIIGNPPYIATEGMHKLETETEFSVYKKKFSSAYKQFDKYFLFLEQALYKIKESGKVCYIVPNKFYKINSGENLRKLLSPKVERLDDFGAAQLFPDKTIYSCILSLANKSEELIYCEVDSPVKLWVGNNLVEVKISNRKLDKNLWKLTTDSDLLRILENSNKALNDVADIFNGIQTSAERPPVYWFSEDEVQKEDSKYVYIHKFDLDYRIEKAILRPYYKPTKKDEKGQETYSILKTDKRIIFPYDEKGKLIDIKTMKLKYAETFKYLSDRYNLLVPKCLNNEEGRDVNNATADTWYQYGRTQALTCFINKPKIIVKVLSKIPMYCYDDKDTFIASGGTAGYCAVTAKEDSKYDLFYIQAWLNHPYTEKLVDVLGSDFEGGFVARGTFLLKKLPFIELDFSDHNQKAIYDIVVSLSKQVRGICFQLDENIDKATREVLKAEKQRIVSKIEACITKVYRQEF
ncbi:MAG: Eco57I restriction-modification methylase domain-containing protein [Spirochaetia bacterium]|nr:Eco57I restriction-modification methylase domain-containing protein [Spirochaetia bacterium]